MTSSTKTCPYCAEEIRSEAVKCRFCGSRLDRSVIQAEWRRTERGKMIAGVCAGLAEQFDNSVTVIRLAFVLASLFSAGTGILVYVILWIDTSSEFRVFVANGTDQSTPWPANFTKPVNLTTETGPITLVTRYDVAEGKATLWVNGTSESDARVVATDYQVPVSVGFVGMFQERGNGDIYLDDMTVTVVVKPLITSVSQPAGGNVDLDFSAGPNDAPSDFQVERADRVAGAFSTVAAEISSLGGGNFRAKVAAPGSEAYWGKGRKCRSCCRGRPSLPPWARRA